MSNIYKSMSLDATMVSIHPHFTIKDGKKDQCIALLEEILVMTKANEPDCFFFLISLYAGQTGQTKERHIKKMMPHYFILRIWDKRFPSFLKCQMLLCKFKVLLRRLKPKGNIARS